MMNKVDLYFTNKDVVRSVNSLFIVSLILSFLWSCQNFSSRKTGNRKTASFASTKNCSETMLTLLDLKEYGPLLKSPGLESAYSSIVTKKAETAHPDIPSHKEVSLVGKPGQQTFDQAELSPGLESGLLERIREVGGVFDDYKLVSDAKVRDLTLEEQMAVLKEARAKAKESGATGLEQERVFLKQAAEGLYNFSKDLESVKVEPTSSIEPPRFDHPGLRGNHQQAYDYTQSYWSELTKKTPAQAEGSILPLPYEFPVANASRFDEMYYWDTYFGLQGLMPSGHLELAQRTVENFLYLIREYGIIPNGNRDYYLSRSQPPFVSSMVRDVFEESLKKQPERTAELKEWLAKRAYPLLKKDFEEFWMNPKTRYDEQTGLHHHFDEVNLARPERHSADKELADDWDDPQGLGLDYVDTRAVAESGLDFTDVLGKEASQVANPLLNSMIYKYAKDLEKFALDLGLEEEAKKYANMAQKKKEAMSKYMWDEESGFFRTYHIGQKKLLEGVHAESYAALFAGVASDEQAKAMQKSLMVLEREGGVMSSDLVGSHHQWDGLNGWAPLHFFIIKGFDRYGYKEDAERVALKIANSYADIYEKEGVYLERIDVLKGTRPLEDGKKYPVQEGFLWTNGLYNWILTKFLTPNKTDPLFPRGSVRTQKVEALLSEYPKLSERHGSITGKVVSAPQVKSLEEIPYEISDNFRSEVARGNMLERVKELDPEIAEMLLKSYNTLNDPKVLGNYFENLFIDAALWMQRKGKAADLKLLADGVVSEQAIGVVLVRRLKYRGVGKFTTLTKQVELSSGKVDFEALGLSTHRRKDVFRGVVKTGPFFDFAYNPWERGGHGAFTHMMQRDIVSQQVISGYSEPQRFWDFLGSKKGIHFWVDVFDSNNKGSFNRPENLTEFVTHTLSGDPPPYKPDF